MRDIVVKFDFNLLLIYVCYFLLFCIFYKKYINKMEDRNPFGIVIMVLVGISISFFTFFKIFFNDAVLYLDLFIMGWISIFCIAFVIIDFMLWLCTK